MTRLARARRACSSSSPASPSSRRRDRRRTASRSPPSLSVFIVVLLVGSRHRRRAAQSSAEMSISPFLTPGHSRNRRALAARRRRRRRLTALGVLALAVLAVARRRDGPRQRLGGRNTRAPARVHRRAVRTLARPPHGGSAAALLARRLAARQARARAHRDLHAAAAGPRAVTFARPAARRAAVQPHHRPGPVAAQRLRCACRSPASPR